MSMERQNFDRGSVKTRSGSFWKMGKLIVQALRELHLRTREGALRARARLGESSAMKRDVLKHSVALALWVVEALRRRRKAEKPWRFGQRWHSRTLPSTNASVIVDSQ